MELGRRIAQARHEAGFGRAEDFAPIIGRSVHTVRDYESGRVTPPLEVLRRIAEATGRPLSWFTGEQQSDISDLLVRTGQQLEQIRSRLDGQLVTPRPAEMIRLPVLGCVPAGNWEEALAHAEEFMAYPAEAIPPDVDTSAAYLLRVHGDSMISAGIFDGDVVLVEPATDLDDGEIAVVADGGDCTLKYVQDAGTRQPLLVPANPTMSPMRVPEGALIIGRVRGLQRHFPRSPKRRH